MDAKITLENQTGQKGKVNTLGVIVTTQSVASMHF